MSPWRSSKPVQPGLRRVTPRDVQHLLGEIEADGALHPVGQQGQHAPGARTQVDQAAERPGAHRLQHRTLDRGLLDIEAAQLVPAGGVAGEIGRRGVGALAAHLLQPLGVAADQQVIGRDLGQRLVEHRAARAVGGQAVEHPGAVRETFGQAGLGQELQMARDTRLALVQNLAQFHHRQLLAG